MAKKYLRLKKNIPIDPKYLEKKKVKQGPANLTKTKSATKNKVC